MGAKPQPTEPSAATVLFNTLPASSPENRRRIALAFLEETGDVPYAVEHSFGMVAADAAEDEAIAAEIAKLRSQHFAELGRPVPERVFPKIR